MVDAHYSPKIIAAEVSSTEAPNDCYFTAKATAIITVCFVATALVHSSGGPYKEAPVSSLDTASTMMSSMLSLFVMAGNNYS